MGGRKASVGGKGLWRHYNLRWWFGSLASICSWVCGCGFPCIGQSERYQGIPHTIWRKSVGVGFRRQVIVLIVWVSWWWRLAHRSSIIGDMFRMVLQDSVYICYQYHCNSTWTFILDVAGFKNHCRKGWKTIRLFLWWITERERWYND